MKLTREQFDEIGKFYLDDFPVSSNQDIMFELFNNLPSHIQGEAISWGFNDTVFRDNVFEFLCKNQLGITCKEYYKSKIAKDYFDNGVLIELDSEKMKK
jgi:hypothetical protein